MMSPYDPGPCDPGNPSLAPTSSSGWADSQDRMDRNANVTAMA